MIAVPLDGSPFGKRALPMALALARRNAAALHLVHVHEPIVYSGGAPMYDTRFHDELRREMQTELTALAAQLMREISLPVDLQILDGPVVRTLQRYLTDRRPDLVVMMTHGRGGLQRAWLGSVAEGLIRHATVPVLLVRPGEQWPGNRVEPRFHHVLIALDGSTSAEEVLDHVLTLATPDATMYTLLRVIVPLKLAELYAYESFSGRPDVERQRDTALEYLTHVAKRLSQSGAAVETRVVLHQRPGQGIIDYAEAQHVDLIALSTHGHGALSRHFLGSVADKIVRGAAVPVLVYHPAHAGADSPDASRATFTDASGRRS